MSDFTLYLDSIAFRHFEIPDNIKAGGAQSLFKHKYPGGTRTIDTMGPDDVDIAWSGIFMDGGAQDRCKQLDILRRQGLPVVLTWAGYQYLVVIANFEWNFKRLWHIEYNITLAVVQDQTQPAQSVAQDVDGQISSDISIAKDSASSIAAALSGLIASSSGAVNGTVTSTVQGALTSASVALSSALGGIDATLGSVTSISGATVDFQAALGTQVGSALGVAQGLQATLNGALSAAGNPALFAGGTSPQAMIANLNNLSGLSTAMAASVDCSNALGVTDDNMNDISDSGGD